MLWNVTKVEYMHNGHMACPGCGASLSMRHALKALGEETVVIIPACCWSIIGGIFPTSALSVPALHVPFATAAACASGVRRALLAQGREKVTVMVWAGDGGTFDIGLQALSGAADRKEDFLYVCYDNEAYMNTGVQQSSATPGGAWTSTTPGGKEMDFSKKDMFGIIKNHHPSYLATASVGHPEDFYAKFVKAYAKRGFRFLHLLSVCPPGWRIDSQDSVRIARMAVESGIFPLLEFEAGGEVRQTVIPENPIPVNDYIKAQERFRNMGAEEIKALQATIDERNRRLLQHA
ncbi:MAG: pyruvate synthase subunit beta [Desulfobacterales bacterium]|nr:pyruvate synthase subunit beta [Desulfobacterales bacterium]